MGFKLLANIGRRPDWRQVFLLALVVLILNANMAHADELYYRLSSQLSADYDNNYSLTKTNQRSVRKAGHRVEAEWGAESPNRLVSLSARNDFSTYRGDVTTDEGIKDLSSSNNQYYSGTFRWDLSETSTVSATADYQQDTTSADEFIELFGGLVGTGRDLEKERQTLNLSLSHRWTISPIWQLVSDGSVMRLDYDDADNTALIAYDYWTMSASVYRLMTERFDLYSSLAFSRFRPKPSDTVIQEMNSVRSDTANVNVGLRWQLSETQSTDISLGYRESRFKRFSAMSSEERETDNGGVFTVNYLRAMESGDANLTLSRRLSPASDGRMTETDTLGLGWRYLASEKSEHRLGANARRERERGSAAATMDESFQQLSYAFAYRIRPQHRLGVTVRYRWYEDGSNENSTVGGRAEGAGLRLTWSWSSRKLPW